MKLLLLLLIPFFSIAQDSTYEPGDSTWITSSDTGKVKVYKYNTHHQTGVVKMGDSYWFGIYPVYTMPTGNYNVKVGPFPTQQSDTNTPRYDGYLDPSSVKPIKIKSFKAPVNKCPLGKTWRPRFDDDYWVELEGCYTKKKIKALDDAITRHYKEMPANPPNQRYRIFESLDSSATQALVDTLKAHGRTIHYTSKGNKVYDELCGGEGWKKMAAKFTKVIERKDVVYDIYPDPVSIYSNYTDEPAPPAKYDTIGPVWKQVSDTGPGYNPVFAMEVFEVRVYNNEWVTDLQPMDGGYYDNGKKQQLIPYHFAWLDLGKKPVKYKVWQDKTIEP